MEISEEKTGGKTVRIDAERANEPRRSKASRSSCPPRGFPSPHHVLSSLHPLTLVVVLDDFDDDRLRAFIFTSQSRTLPYTSATTTTNTRLYLNRSRGSRSARHPCAFVPFVHSPPSFGDEPLVVRTSVLGKGESLALGGVVFDISQPTAASAQAARQIPPDSNISALRPEFNTIHPPYLYVYTLSL